MLMYSICFT